MHGLCVVKVSHVYTVWQVCHVKHCRPILKLKSVYCVIMKSFQTFVVDKQKVMKCKAELCITFSGGHKMVVCSDIGWEPCDRQILSLIWFGLGKLTCLTIHLLNTCCIGIVKIIVYGQQKYITLVILSLENIKMVRRNSKPKLRTYFVIMHIYYPGQCATLNLTEHRGLLMRS